MRGSRGLRAGLGPRGGREPVCSAAAPGSVSAERGDELASPATPSSAPAGSRWSGDTARASGPIRPSGPPGPRRPLPRPPRRRPGPCRGVRASPGAPPSQSAPASGATPERSWVMPAAGVADRSAASAPSSCAPRAGASARIAASPPPAIEPALLAAAAPREGSTSLSSPLGVTTTTRLRGARRGTPLASDMPGGASAGGATDACDGSSCESVLKIDSFQRRWAVSIDSGKP